MSESKMKKQAFLIGINQYAALPELKYARQDAEAIEQALKQNYSFSDNEVMLMTDAKPGLFKPFNKRVIQMHLENLANQELDLFIFGFWGHGLFRNGERYLCPLDVMNVDVVESGFSFTELQRLLSKIRAKNTCMILDCCQTIHDSRGEAETLTVADQTNMENAARDIVFRRKEQYPEFVSNVAILNSCKEGQSSYEWDKRQHGVFTSHLLDAMNQRYESVAKIIAYISSSVEKTAMELGKMQTPFYKLEGDIQLPANRTSTPFVAKNVPSVVSQRPKSEPKKSQNSIADFLNSEQERLQNEALEAFQNEQYRTAISILEDILKQKPDDKSSKDLLTLCRQKIDNLYLTGKRYYEGNNVTKDFEEAAKWFRKAAEQGNASAQYALGNCYYNGEGVLKDWTEAVKWYRQAAEQGNASAQYVLGNCYYNGWEVDKNYKEAEKWYRKAAEQGHSKAKYMLGDTDSDNINYGFSYQAEQWFNDAVNGLQQMAEQDDAEAQYMLGKCYEYGRGVSRNHKDAVYWYREAAEQGYSEAQISLGDCYYFGNGISEDKAESVKWYRKAAEQGDAGAQYTLGDCYYYGKGVSEDKAEAVKWYRKAAERGNCWASVQMGNCYYKGEGVSQDYEESVKWYRKAAEQGDVEAQYALGDCYYNGIGVPQDKAEAEKWYLKSAEQEGARALYELGRRFYNGSGYGNSDKSEAVKWFRMAAEQGYVEAQTMLGNCYYNGDGVSEDKAEAVKWYRKAAEQGNAEGQVILGDCYFYGDGVPEDDDEAKRWYSKAAEQGNGVAKKKIKILNSIIYILFRKIYKNNRKLF